MHNLVNLGYLSVSGDCFYIMKCVHSKAKCTPDPREADGEPLQHVSCLEPTLTRLGSHSHTQGITHANPAAQWQPHLTSINTAFYKVTLHITGPRPHPPLPTKRPWKTQTSASHWRMWHACYITWMKSKNVRGSKSSMCPMSLEKRFKIRPAKSGCEKLVISPDRCYKETTPTNQSNASKYICI